MSTLRPDSSATNMFVFVLDTGSSTTNMLPVALDTASSATNMSCLTCFSYCKLEKLYTRKGGKNVKR